MVQGVKSPRDQSAAKKKKNREKSFGYNDLSQDKQKKVVKKKVLCYIKNMTIMRFF